MIEFNKVSNESYFIKNLLYSTFLPLVRTVRENDYIIRDRLYIYKCNIIRCTSSGYIPVKNTNLDVSQYPQSLLRKTDDEKIRVGQVYYTFVGDSVKRIIGGRGDTRSPIAEGWYEENIASYDIIGEYYFGERNDKFCRNFLSSSEGYDYKTHEKLGQYLRSLRDMYGLNLLPLYNCFSNQLLRNIHITNSSVQRTSADYSTKVYRVPIRFNTDYTICMDNVGMTTFAPAFIHHGTLLKLNNNRFGNGLDATNKYIKLNHNDVIHNCPNLRFKNPIKLRFDNVPRNKVINYSEVTYTEIPAKYTPKYFRLNSSADPAYVKKKVDDAYMSIDYNNPQLEGHPVYAEGYEFYILGETESGLVPDETLFPEDDLILPASGFKVANITEDDFVGNEENYFLYDSSTHAFVQCQSERTPQVETVENDTNPVIVPSGAKLATVQKYGGKSLVFNQLVQNGNFASTSGWTTNPPATISVANNKLTVVANGTGAGKGAYRFVNIVAGHKYLQCATVKPSTSEVAFGVQDSRKTYALTANVKTLISEIFTGTSTGSKGIALYFNATLGTDTAEWENAMVIDLTQMFGAGNEPTTVAEVKALLPNDYYEYNTGEVIHASVDKVVEQGVNLYNPTYIEDYVPCDLPSGTSVTAMIKDFISTDPSVMINYYDANKTRIDYWTLQASNSGQKTFTLSGNAKFFNFDGSGRDVSSYGSRLYFGTSATYHPYRHNEHAIPQAIRNLEGYGWSAGNVYNEVDFERKKFIKRVDRVDLSTKAWNYYTGGTNPVFTCDKVTDNALGVRGTMPNILFEKYTIVTSNDRSTFAVNMNDKEMSVINGYVSLCVRDTSYTDATAFRNSLAGVYLYYELATPVETDISDILDSFEVEAGGTITFHNSNGDGYRLPVPSTEEYTVYKGDTFDENATYFYRSEVYQSINPSIGTFDDVCKSYKKCPEDETFFNRTIFNANKTKYYTFDDTNSEFVQCTSSTVYDEDEIYYYVDKQKYEGWYEFVGNQFVKTQDTYIDLTKTYYKKEMTEVPMTYNYDITEDNCCMYDYIEDELYLLIQVPSVFDSNIVILEGDYTEDVQEKLYDIGKFELFSNSKLDYLFTEDLILMETNTKSLRPFSPTLIQFLLWNAICNLDTINNDLDRLSIALDGITTLAGNPQFNHNYWYDKYREAIFDYAKEFPRKYIRDNLGYVTRDIERIIYQGQEFIASPDESNYSEEEGY